MNSIMNFSNEERSIINQIIRHDWSVPEFKAKHFIANSHIHPLHKIKQLMMELGNRIENLEVFELDVERFKIQIELEEEKALKSTLEAERKLHKLEALALTKKLTIGQEKLKTAKLEVDKFIRLIKQFNESNEGKNENGVLYIDILNDRDECERIEAKYWEYRLAKQAALDMIAYGRIGVGNMDAIMQLDADAQNKCLAMAYEVLITNESRMNQISDSVVKLLQNGNTVSDIGHLLNIEKTDFVNQLEYKKQDLNKNVPLIQKC